MKTLCYSVRLKDMRRISDKAYKAVAFDGSEAIIPASQVFGIDFGVEKSDAWWISAWILERKELQYSERKQAYFDEHGKMTPVTIVEKHIAPKKEIQGLNEVKDLLR